MGSIFSDNNDDKENIIHKENIKYSNNTNGNMYYNSNNNDLENMGLFNSATNNELMFRSVGDMIVSLIPQQEQDQTSTVESLNNIQNRNNIFNHTLNNNQDRNNIFNPTLNNNQDKNNMFSPTSSIPITDLVQNTKKPISISSKNITDDDIIFVIKSLKKLLNKHTQNNKDILQKNIQHTKNQNNKNQNNNFSNKTINKQQDVVNINQDKSRNNQNKLRNNQNTSDIDQDTLRTNQDTSDIDQDKLRNNQNASDVNQNASDVNQNTSDVNQNTSDVNQNASISNQNTLTNQSITTNTPPQPTPQSISTAYTNNLFNSIFNSDDFWNKSLQSSSRFNI